ncbi:MAG: 50S ribosomal protein L11 methyltransferase [Oscillospiraceae bacterium]
MNWTEINIFTTTEGVDTLCGCLLGTGITGFSIKDAKDFEEFLKNKTGNWDYIDDDLMGLKTCETCVTAYLPDNSQGAEMLIAIKSELARLKNDDTANAFGRLALELSNVKEEDWANNWKQYFKPFTIGKKLAVKPSWENFENSENRLILEIDPASSFGTGQHHTTRLCLELLENYVKSGDKVLDIGCGSGILSIAAVLLGAKSVYAVDIEENSAKTAVENAEKNGIFADKFTASCGNILTDNALVEKIGSGYDLISANIVADVLIAMSDLFGKFLKPNGILIMSGVITERKDEVIAALTAQKFALISVNEKEGWTAISMRN